MKRNRADEREFLRIAQESGVGYGDVKSAVMSFFDAIYLSVRRYPFNNPKRIYRWDKFKEYERVWNIPYIGRLGPSYKRYLQWRVNESKQFTSALRSDYKTIYTEEEIESLADYALHEWKEGDPPVEGKSGKAYPFQRVWLVEKNKRRQARQVIPKETDV